MADLVESPTNFFMLEKNFQTYMTHSIKETGGFLYKIPDCGFDRKPFDCCGVYKGKPIAMELKWLSSPKAFPMSRLEDHQLAGLKEWWQAGGWAALVIGVDFARGDKRIYVWKNEELLGLEQRKKDKRNILKKEFQALPYILMKNQKINIDELIL